ncbi:hypothetical protein M408DRAFT_124111 [Serendipita vermifera MAFF 305830]|uniref:Uncharacterized protein n=1 Tax=Serendipita vermifera MAFF 305830 TaxID=933852 RepID=A0A0C3AL38_SERVB|nr:hypothetical protein M408DRAFT_124111 [Serendipita vermifera MAFF 305830]
MSQMRDRVHWESRRWMGKLAEDKQVVENSLVSPVIANRRSPSGLFSGYNQAEQEEVEESGTEEREAEENAPVPPAIDAYVFTTEGTRLITNSALILRVVRGMDQNIFDSYR